MLLGPRSIAVSHRVVLCIAQFPGGSVGPVRVVRETDSLRNQRRMVSGFAATATSANALRPSRWAISAKVRFSPSR